MFTGIITDVGQLRHVEQQGDLHVVIATNYDMSAIEMGASISCSGACMTVADKGSSKDRWFAFTASAETLSKTTIGKWKKNDKVNLERPMRVGDEQAAPRQEDDLGLGRAENLQAERLRVVRARAGRGVARDAAPVRVAIRHLGVGHSCLPPLRSENRSRVLPEKMSHLGGAGQ